MAESDQPTERTYDPLTADRPIRGSGRGRIVALTVVFAFHAVIGYYLWKAKFDNKVEEFTDQG